MLIIKRKMESEINSTSENGMYCQASFNSDGNITLRNRKPNRNDDDELMVLSKEETRAVFKLFSKMSQHLKEYDLPF